jgi:uncharacterized protein
MPVATPILIAIAIGAAFAQGFSGFGFGILFMAALSLGDADLERASVFVMLGTLVLVTTLLVRSHGRLRVDWRQAGGIAAGALITIPLGYRFILHFGDLAVSRAVFGLALIAFAVERASKPHIKRHIPTFLAPFFGMVSGLLSGAFVSGGPPVILYLYAQEEDPRTAVGTAQAVFLGGGLYRLAIVLMGHRGIPRDLWLPALWIAPFVILATLLGFHAAQRFRVRFFLLTVYALVILAGLLNLAKAVRGSC